MKQTELVRQLYQACMSRDTKTEHDLFLREMAKIFKRRIPRHSAEQSELSDADFGGFIYFGSPKWTLIASSTDSMSDFDKAPSRDLSLDLSEAMI